LIHGDAAFAARAIVQETLNLSQLEGYTHRRHVHVIVNNQIGFTTRRREPAPRLRDRRREDAGIPIFHVNGEDPEAVAQVVGSRSTSASASSATWSSTCTATAGGATTRATSRRSRSR
jgi:2-oxoglutarate dehydrogenase complex dehydrogenase (E1) component-like enzyme